MASARQYLGVPFRHQGRDIRGVDCLGLIVCAARDTGIPVVDNLNYGRAPDYETMRAGLLAHLDPIPQTDLRPGDLLFMKWDRRAYPMHLAIVTLGGMIIHADNGAAKRVVEHVLPDKWRALIVQCLRWKRWSNG